MIVVKKFGGTSLANSKQVNQAIEIVEADSRQQVIVVSAPGERFLGDIRVTDLLSLLAKGGNDKLSIRTISRNLTERYWEIADGLGVRHAFNEEYFNTLRRERTFSEVVSRGEYLMGSLLAQALKCRFADPASFIRLNPDGSFNLEETKRCWDALSESLLADGSTIVVPGFYGRTIDGEIKLFPPGGSDITMAVMGILTGARFCEKWTDVPGVHRADPRVVPSPAVIPNITFEELDELSYGGEGVLHPGAIALLEHTDTSVRIRHTNKPQNEGTLVTRKREVPAGEVVGIAGREGFLSLVIRQTGMNPKVGAALRIFAILADERVSVEHISTGIDGLCLVIEEKQIKDMGVLVRKLSNGSSSVKPRGNLALLCIVGEGMAVPGVSANTYAALAGAGINVRFSSQGDDELNIVVGVDDHNFERAMNALHGTFFRYS